MKKILLIALAVAVAGVIPAYNALATCTVTQTNATNTVNSCTATTEAGPTLATDGRSIAGAKGVSVAVVSTGAMTAGGTLAAWTYWPQASQGSQWVRTPDLDLTASAATNQSWSGLVVTVPVGRIDYRPSALGANNTLVYISTSSY